MKEAKKIKIKINAIPNATNAMRKRKLRVNFQLRRGKDDALE